MGTFETTTARQELGFTPTTGVRANIDVRTGGAEVARAITGAGLAVVELGMKFDILEAKTQLSEQSIAAADAQIEFFTGLEGNNEPRTYGDELQKLFTNLDSLAPKNSKAARIYNQKIATTKISLALKTRKLARKKQESKSQTADFLLLQKAKETGDFVSYKVSIINGVKLEVYTAKEGETLLDAADVERDKKEKNDTFGLALTQRDEEGILDIESANEIINSSEVLTTDEKNDLQNQITNRSIQERNQRDQQFQNKMGDEAERLGELLQNGELIEQEMDEIDLGGVGDQKTKEEDFKLKWKKLLRDTNSRSEPLNSNESTYDALTVGSELVERGKKPPAEWETEFAEANADGLLNKNDRRTLRSKDTVATRTMQNRTYSDAITNERATFVEIAGGEIDRILLAKKNAELIQDIPSITNFNISLKKNQAQRWNMGRFRDELRNQINQNPDWSVKQINTARDILVDQLDIPDDELLRAFDEQNPNRAITKTSPDTIFNDIWGDLSFEDKSIIWAGRMAGIPASVLNSSVNINKARGIKE